MTNTPGSRREGIYRDDEGTIDSEGFVAPSVGLVEHALYFTTAPDVLAKTRQVIDENRLELPGAVVVWDETIGRRKGAKAVPGAWWASNGSLTISLVFPGPVAGQAHANTEDVAAAVLEAIASFSPSTPVSYDGSGIFALDEKPVGMIHHDAYNGVDIFVIRVHCNTDFSKAPTSVQGGHSRLIDYIDQRTLPLGKAGTLPNTLALELMKAVPAALGWPA